MDVEQFLRDNFEFVKFSTNKIGGGVILRFRPTTEMGQLCVEHNKVKRINFSFAARLQPEIIMGEMYYKNLSGINIVLTKYYGLNVIPTKTKSLGMRIAYENERIINE